MLDELGNRQRPVWRRPLDEQVDLLGLGRGDVDQHVVLSLALDVADGQRTGVADIGGFRHRIERIGQVAVLGACHAGKGEFGMGFDGNAELFADRVADTGPKRHRLVGIFCDDPQRQHDLLLVSQRGAAGAVVKFLRRRPQHGHGVDVVRF